MRIILNLHYCIALIIALLVAYLFSIISLIYLIKLGNTSYIAIKQKRAEKGFVLFFNLDIIHMVVYKKLFVIGIQGSHLQIHHPVIPSFSKFPYPPNLFVDRCISKVGFLLGGLTEKTARLTPGRDHTYQA